MKPQELSINGELFEETRDNIDTTIRMLIARMISTGIKKGTVSLKLSIELKEYIADGGEIVRMPDISYSVGMGMTEKDTMKGNLHRGMILKRSECGRLMVIPDQVSMDDVLAEEQI